MTSSHRDVDLQIFLGSTSERALRERRDGFPSFSFMASPRGATRDITQQGGAETRQVGAADYVAIANSEVVETVQLPFTQEETLRIINGLGTNNLRLQDYVSFGVRLFDFVFHRRLRDLYRDLLRKASARDRALRVTIATSAPELAVLPWELMCDTYPEILPRFLCHDSRVRLTRALRLYNRRRFRENKSLGEDGELRILAVSAVPPGKSPIEAGMDGRMIDYVRRQMPARSRVTVKFCDDATVERLREVGREFRPHIVHLACHAGYNQEEDLGVVQLMPSAGARANGEVHSYQLAMLMHEIGSVQCMFANTCYGAHQGNTTIFSGIAQALHALGIANVVALQFTLTDTTAHAIVLGFYTHLLLQGMPVERAVGELQRRMYLEGYSPSETFGLVLFQTNCSLRVALPAATDMVQTLRGAPTPVSVAAMPEHFDATEWKWIEDERRKEASAPAWSEQGEVDWSAWLPLHEVLLAYSVFESWRVTLSLLWRVKQIFTPKDVDGVEKAGREAVQMFVRLARQAQRMAMSTFENHPLQTGIALVPESAVEEYKAAHGLPESSTKPLDKPLFEMQDGEVTKRAEKVDGESLAFVVTFPPAKGPTIVQALVPHVGEPSAFPTAAARWQPLAAFAARGCAFALPGRGRAKLFLGGEQLLEFASGRWLPAELRQVHERLSQIAGEIDVNRSLLLDVFEKCLVASEKAVGKAFILQQGDAILERSVTKGFDPRADLLNELRDNPITEIDPQRYLKGVGGDHAVVLARDGRTLGVNVPLAPSTRTEVDRVPGTGARHLTAQQITKETDAVALVVSTDGPISVFHEGKLILSYLRAPAAEP